MLVCVKDFAVGNACGRFKQTAGVAYICQLCINYDVCLGEGERIEGETERSCARDSERGRRFSGVQGAWRQNYLPHLRPKAGGSYVKL